MMYHRNIDENDLEKPKLFFASPFCIKVPEEFRPTALYLLNPDNNW